ncbi:MAG: RHS repeat-associated core domain-containing protein [Patescibacteria group bacterium]
MRKIVSVVLICAHILVFGGVKESLAFGMAGSTLVIQSGAVAQGAGSRAASNFSLVQDGLGESCVGRAQSAALVLESGYMATIKSNPPILTQAIPNQNWQENEAKTNAFDFDDHFLSFDGNVLNYSVSGNQNIVVQIDPATHEVGFSQAQGWFGTEKVVFKAEDTEGNSVNSNEVTLQVGGVDNAPVLDYIPDIYGDENQEIVIMPHATDLDDDEIAYAFTAPFDAQGRWQTDFDDAGMYVVTVTATDATGLVASQNVKVNVSNVNRPPVLSTLTDITVQEGQLVAVIPQATDADGDAISYYFSSPLDTTGKWLTGYDDAGSYSYSITASDGIDTVTENGCIVVSNVNRPPEVDLTLSAYTINKGEDVVVRISSSDPDGDGLVFVLKKDSQEIASGDLNGVYEKTVSFDNAGDHVVSAIVTDMGGLSVESSAGVDVVDPNASTNLMFPIMGDFNGDALCDLGLYNGATGVWEVVISEGGVFTNAADWLQSGTTGVDVSPVGGDFNGDGKADAGLYNKTNGELRIALSTGSGLSLPALWLDFTENPSSWLVFSGNFNGDKYCDFGLYNKETGEVRVVLSQGSGFGAMTTWLAGFGTNYSVLMGDFNGDSLADLCLVKKTSGEYKVALSNGRAFVDGGVWISGFGAGKDPVVSDYNNDGISDIGYWDKLTPDWYFAVSTGEDFSTKGLLGSFGSSADEFVTTGDFNGDGISDRASYDHELIGILRWKTQIVDQRSPDLLHGIDNGIGGKTEIVYSYASAADNPYLPFPVQVASEIKIIDTLPVGSPQEAYSQQFIFSDGYYDAGEREFRGFGKVKAIDPIAGNYTETYFYQGKSDQDGALKGQIEKIVAFDGNARQISQTVNTYDVRKAGPTDNVLGFSALVRQDTTVWEEGGVAVSTASEFAYDAIGNLLEAKSLGDISKEGDEKATETTYAQAYQDGLNRPVEVLLKDKDGVTVTKKSLEYDSRGNLSKESVFILNPLTGSQQSVVSIYSYDIFGNVLTTTDALGRTVTTEYETVFNSFPLNITNTLGHMVSYVYDPKLGVITQSTDPNGNTSSTSHDSLGRPIQTMNAYAEVTIEFNYPDFNTKVSRQGNLEKMEYVDGLARKYKTVSSGEDGENSRQVSTEAYFDDKGRIEKESMAHYVDEPETQISYVKYEYDIRGRIKKTISDFPGTAKDAESQIFYVAPLYVETVDPMGHKKGTLKDVYGNIIEVTEFTQGGVFKTVYEYDIQDNLLKVTDAQGNASQIWYDSAGRKIRMDDPDMGVWTYEYDLLGNLIKQVDAKNQVLEFSYDDLNRLTGKQADGQMLVTYIYDEAAKENCIGRLSKVVDGSGTTEFFYDKLGREIKSVKTVDAHAYEFQREYDAWDRLTKLIYPDAEVVEYSYDINSGFLDKVFSSSNTTNYVNSMNYDAQGRMRQIQYANGTCTDYMYGQDLRLARIHTMAGSADLQDLNYVFDKNGNVVTLTDNLRNNIRTFGYDELDRLTSAQNIPDGSGTSNHNFQYDAIGNMTYKSDVGFMLYGANVGPHAVTSAGSYSYQYDANGNMTSGKNKTLEYDVENRIIRITQPDAVTSFMYDGDGGRVKASRTANNEIRTTTYIGSLFEIQASASGQQAMVKHIFAGSTRVCSVKSVDGGASTTDYYHGDHLGSSSIITDQDGQQVQYLEYAPYGTVAHNEGTDATAYKFTGKELDSTGLYFYSARYYDPEIGRFVSADTIVQAPYDPQSLNRYAYCRNNPIKYVDPSGHFFWVAAIIGAIVGAISGGISAAQAGGSIWGGIFFGAVFGGATGAIGFGVGQALQAAAEAAKQAITAVGGALITGLEFGIGAVGSGMASGFAGGEGSFLDVLKGGAIGFGTGFITGAAVGYSYAKGWQSILHGADIRATNAKIFMDQVGSGNYGGAQQTLSTDRTLQIRLKGAKVHFTSEKGLEGIQLSQTIREGQGGKVYLADLLPGFDAPSFTANTLQIPSPNQIDSSRAQYFVGLNSKNLMLSSNLVRDSVSGWTRFEYIHEGSISLSNTQVYGYYSNNPSGHAAYMKEVLTN